MLTRSQVARQLGKSIATVRRLEGRVLHPLVGRRSVRLFYEWEVDRLRANPAQIACWGSSTWLQERRARRARTSRPPVAPASARSEEAAAAIMDVLEALLAVPLRRLLRLGVDEQMMENLIRAARLVGAD